MIKWPEPAGYIRSDQLRKVQEGWAYLCDVGPEPRIDKQPIYTEAQLKQAVRDAYEEAAKVAQETVCDTHIPTGINIYGTRAAKAIRALIKEMPDA